MFFCVFTIYVKTRVPVTAFCPNYKYILCYLPHLIDLVHRLVESAETSQEVKGTKSRKSTQYLSSFFIHLENMLTKIPEDYTGAFNQSNVVEKN